MILSKSVKIKPRKNKRDYYNKLGYDVYDDIILVNIDDLHKGSNAKIFVKCDNCDTVLEMTYKSYYQYINRNDDELYYCKDCKYIRTKQTNIKKYGVDNVMKVKSIKKKSMDTQKERYGFSCFGNRDIDNIIKKYGNIETYYNIIYEKKKKTCLEKYGVDNVMKVDNIKEKGKETCLEKYGVENPMFLEEFVKKSKTNQIKTKIKTNIIIADSERSDYEYYKIVIRRLVYKHKDKLFKDWDGKDYYDDEYIKENVKLKYTDKNYPTIDHKISVYYGFKNKIDPYVIGDINNMCITKRSINSSKGIKTTYNKNN